MVDIVIVNWNSSDYLYKCIRSIFTNNNDKVLGSVIIIDNNSTDGSLQKICPHKKIVIIQNKENRGFSRACNQGFKLCNSPYVLLLNPDIKILESTIGECVYFMSQHRDVDILGCQLLNDEGSISYSCARFPTLLRFFYDLIGLSKISPKIFKPALLMTDWDHNKSMYVDQVMGAFMFMRLSIFRKFGYFDEQFFVYYEELDFSKRIANLGGKTFFNSSIKAIHSGGGTTANVKAYRLFLNIRSRLKYARKHFRFVDYKLLWFCTYLIEPFTRIIFLMLKGNFKGVIQVIKGYKMLLNSK